MDDFPRLSRKERLILELLVSHGGLYGLQLVKESAGELKRGTVYVTLDRMADKGFVESRQVAEPEPAEGEPKRGGLPLRIYSATGLGQRTLQALEMAQAHLVGL